MSGHLGELSTGEGVHEAGLTDTVSAHQSVLAPIGQLEVGSLEQGLSCDDQ